MDAKKRAITYSMIRSFQTCRVQYDYRYNKNIVPVDTPHALYFGSAVHAALEAWFKYGDEEAARVAILKEGLEEEDMIKATVLVEKYIEHWGEEPFRVIGVEHEFSEPLINPKTRHPSRTFQLCGKADGIVLMDGEHYILEHKTCANISQEYLDRILIDTQIALYANAISRQLGVKVVGAIYDILEKPQIRMKKGETESEFEARRAELIAKSKTGKTTAQRKMPESAQEFGDRLREAITESNFHREIVKFDDETMMEHCAEVWKIAEDIRRGSLYKNTGSCSTFGCPCKYLNLCRCKGDLSKCEGLYEFRRAHEELSKETAMQTEEMPW